MILCDLDEGALLLAAQDLLYLFLATLQEVAWRNVWRGWGEKKMVRERVGEKVRVDEVGKTKRGEIN